MAMAQLFVAGSGLMGSGIAQAAIALTRCDVGAEAPDPAGHIGCKTGKGRHYHDTKKRQQEAKE